MAASALARAPVRSSISVNRAQKAASSSPTVRTAPQAGCPLVAWHRSAHRDRCCVKAIPGRLFRYRGIVAASQRQRNVWHLSVHERHCVKLTEYLSIRAICPAARGTCYCRAGYIENRWELGKTPDRACPFVVYSKDVGWIIIVFCYFLHMMIKWNTESRLQPLRGHSRITIPYRRRRVEQVSCGPHRRYDHLLIERRRGCGWP